MPEHVPSDATRTKVRALAGIGMSPDGIGVLLGVDAAAVREHYAGELRAGPAEAEARVRQALHAAAMRGNRAALKMLRT